MVSRLPSLVALLLLLGVSPLCVVGQSSGTYTRYSDDDCVADSRMTNMSFVPGACTANALWHSLDRANYFRFFYDAESTDGTVTQFFYEDSTCQTLVSANQHLLAKCQDQYQVTMPAVATPQRPVFPPAGFLVRRECKESPDCTTGCSFLAVEAGKCHQLVPDPLDRTDDGGLPAIRGASLFCTDGQIRTFSYSDNTCSADQLSFTLSEPSNRCSASREYTVCSANTPSPPPSTEGFIMTTTGCTDEACQTQCEQFGMKPGFCIAQGDVGTAHFCTSTNEILQLRYADRTCGKSPIIGVVKPSDSQCVADGGRSSRSTCVSTATNAPPAASMAILRTTVTSFEGRNCSGALPTQRLYLPNDICVAPAFGAPSVQATCNASASATTINFRQYGQGDSTCTQTASFIIMATANQEGTCQVPAEGQVSYKLGCQAQNNVSPILGVWWPAIVGIITVTVMAVCRL